MTESTHLQKLQGHRLSRLLSAQDALKEQGIPLDDLKAKLSPNAKIATPLDIVYDASSTNIDAVLPPVFHKQRYYSAEQRGEVKEGYEASVSTHELPNYSHWIDRVWNKDTVSFPFVIVRVATAEDIQECVKFAAAHQAKFKGGVCIAGGCHSAMAMTDQSFVIDTIQMHSIDILEPGTDANPSSEIQVSVGPGATLAAVDSKLRDINRLVPVGTNGDTGVAGLTLSGGMGWFMNKFGMTIDSLVAIDVITADGELHKDVRYEPETDNNAVTQKTHQEQQLLWALRGGGGSFGIVTRFQFKTFPIPCENKMLLGTFVNAAPTKEARKQALLNYAKTLQENKTSGKDVDMCGACVLPTGAPVVPTQWIYTGPGAQDGIDEVLKIEESKQLIDPLKERHGSAMSMWETVDHARIQTLVADHQGHGYLYQTAVVLRQVDDATAEHIIHVVDTAPPGSICILLPYTSRVRDFDKDSVRSSYNMRDNAVWLLAEAFYDPSKEDFETSRLRCRDWCRHLVHSLNTQFPNSVVHTSHAFSDARDGEKTATKKQHQHQEEGGDAQLAAQGMDQGLNIAFADSSTDGVLQRLKSVKAHVDPTNLFSQNRKL